jgi:Family of unknown function (DUF6169)
MTPYEFIRIRNTYTFFTDNDIKYNIIFFDGSHYFLKLPSHIPVYEGTVTPSMLGEHKSPPFDPRAEFTISNIFKDFLMTVEDSIVYVCDTSDKRPHVRNRKFNSWFDRSKDADIHKVDTHFVIKEVDVYASLIVHDLNPYRDEIVEIFLNQKKEREIEKNPDQE